MPLCVRAVRGDVTAATEMANGTRDGTCPQSEDERFGGVVVSAVADTLFSA